MRLSNENSRKALEKLATSTDKLTVVNEKLREIQVKNQSAADLAEQFSTGSIDDKLKINQSLRAVGAFQGATVDQRKQFINNPEAARLFFDGIKLLSNFAPDQAKKLRQDAFTALAKPGAELGLGADFASEDVLGDSRIRLIKETDAASEAFHNLGEAGATGALHKAFESFGVEISGITRGLKTIPTNPVAPVAPAGNARGGLIFGPGTGTSDSIPTRLSRGEYVVKAASVNKLGANTLGHINEYGELPGLAGGGLS